MDMHKFPTHLLQVESGTFRFRHDCWVLELNIKPFDLPNGYTDEIADDYKKIETRLSADFVEIKFDDICGQITQVDEPYDSIDASIYLVHAHHPYAIQEVDGTHLPKKHDTAGKLKLRGFIWLEFEGLGYDDDSEYQNTDCSFDLDLIPAKDGWTIAPTQPL